MHKHLGSIQSKFLGPPKLPTTQSLNLKKGQVVKLKQNDPTATYTRMKKLGEGAGGVVWKSKRNATGEIVAIKIAPAEELDSLKNEIALQALSQHENVVKYLETYFFDERIWIVMEMMSGGALTGMLDNGMKQV